MNGATAKGHIPVQGERQPQPVYIPNVAGLAPTCATGEGGSSLACHWPGATHIPTGRTIQTSLQLEVREVTTSSLPMKTIRLENASSNYSPEFPPPVSHVPSERGPRLVLLSTVTSSSGPFTKVQAEPNPFFFSGWKTTSLE